MCNRHRKKIIYPNELNMIFSNLIAENYFEIIDITKYASCIAYDKDFVFNLVQLKNIIRRRIPVALMAERVGISRVTLKSVEDGRPTVSMGIYATALYVLGMLDRLKDIADIAFDFVGQALSSEKLPKRIIIKRNKICPKL